MDFWNEYFCGCGSSEEAYDLLVELFNCFEYDEKYKMYCTTYINHQSFIEKYSTGVFNLLMYFLSGMDVMEHGGSIYGSWLTKGGEEIYKQLKDPTHRNTVC